MIIQITGPWKQVTLADQTTQIQTIFSKMGTYKTLLDIQTSAIDRVKQGRDMLLFLNSVQSNLEGYKTGNTAYRQQLLNGNKLQMMNPFQDITPFGTAPTEGLGGLWHFIESQRAIYMEHDNWTDTIGRDMQLLGPLENFDTDTYVPALKIKIFPGIIEVHTDSAIIPNHKLFVGASDVSPLPFITDFKGAVYKYARILPAGVTSEKLDVMVQGMWNNTVIGHDSDTHTIAYKG